MMKLFMMLLMVALVGSIGAVMVMADDPPSASFTDPCYVASASFDGNLTNLLVQDVCTGTMVSWDDLNLTILGNVTDGEVQMGEKYVFVDTALRPDLDMPATMVFNRSGFVMEPEVNINGVGCVAPNCNVSFVGEMWVVEVSGFSNYSLTGRKDFTVYSDTEPELASKVYQTIDLGDGKRGTEYACIVQIFGLNGRGQYVLLQTNPLRQVQAKLLGNPDTNQPESLGYFPTKAGVANVYFRGDIQPMAGYEDFEYVAQCSPANGTKLVYEEPISTRYPQMGRTMVGRGIWLTQDSNAFFMIIFVVIVFIGSFLAVKYVRLLFRW
jgi:hypothetical protein